MNDSLRKTNVCFAHFADRTVSPNFQTHFPQNFHRKHFFYGSSSSLKTWINIFFYCETVGSLNIFGTSTLKRLLFDDKFSDLFGTSWISESLQNVLMYPSSEIWTNIT